MRHIQVNATIQDKVTLRSMKVVNGGNITDETRNTVYNVMRIKGKFIEPTDFILDVSLLDGTSLLV